MNETVALNMQKIREGDNAGVIREAIIELSYEKDKAVYPVFVEQLGSTNTSIQHAAVIALGRYGNPNAIQELIKPKILKSSTMIVRWAAVVALGRLGDYRVMDHLLKAVDDPEWIVHNQAVTELKEKIREIIKEKKSSSASVLGRMLALQDQEIVELVIEGFSELGEKSIGLLIKALESTSPLIRMNAARALGVMQNPQAVDSLLHLLGDPEWSVRWRTVEALGKIQDKKAIEPLVQVLRDPVEKVHREAMKSLVQFGKSSTDSLLGALAYEKGKFAQRAMLLTLGEIGDPKSIPALIGYLSSSYFVVRTAAVQALIKFGSQVKEALLLKLSFNESDIRPLLKEAVDYRNPTLQLRAIKALGGLEEHRAVKLLKKIADEGTGAQKEAATQALVQIGCAMWGRCSALIVLSEIGDASITPYLIHSLKDDSDNVRVEAVRALAKVDSFRAIDFLVKAVRKDKDPYIRFEAIRILRRIGVGYPQVLSIALSALRDKSWDVRSQAARLLGNFRDDGSLLPLIKAMADPHWGVRESAENALMNFGERAIPPLLTALGSSNWTTRFRASRLLGEFGDTRAIKPLEMLLTKKGERKKVRQVAQEALRKLHVKFV